MANDSTAIEKIRPQIVDGKIVKTGQQCDFVRICEDHRTQFPAGSEVYLQAFLQKNTIQEIIQTNSKNGVPINFRLLKETLSTLYWSENLVNASDFLNAIEDTDGVPVNGGHILEPVVEINLDSEALLFQMMVLSVPLALLFLTEEIYTSAIVPGLSILLFPQAFLNLKGGLSAFVNTFQSNKPQSLALHISPLGIYVRQSVGQRSSMGAAEIEAIR